MKVIFLDIDGVLNIIPKTHDRFGGTFHEHLVKNLKTIVDKTEAKIVISSTRRHSGLKIMQEMWQERNLPGEVIDVTIDLGMHQDDDGFWQSEKRGDEIKIWVDKNKPNSYVIIDDDTDMLPDQMRNFVQTSGNINHPDCIDIGYGLTEICSEKAIRILNG